MGNHRARRSLGAVSLSIAAVAIALVAPMSALAATTVVHAIPGGGWIQSPDNTAGETAEIVTGPAGGTGLGSLALKVNSNTDFVGVARPLVQPLADVTAGSWRTFVAGDTANPDAEPAVLKFAIFRTGTTEFTTLNVERFRNGTVTPGTWQETTLGAASVVWQTNTTDGFCIQSAPCAFSDFVAHYPQGAYVGVQVAVGTGTLATTSFVDVVSLTVDGATSTWDFDPAAAPTPRPTPRPTSGGGAVPTQPPTSTLEPTAPGPESGLPSIVVAVVVLTGLLGWAAAWRTRTRTPVGEHREKPRR